MGYDDFIEHWSQTIVEKSDLMARATAIAECAKQLSKQERTRALAHVSAQIEANDELAIEVARLAGLKELLPMLESLVVKAKGLFRVQVVKTIAQLGNGTGLEDYLIEVLDEEGSKEAVDALAEYRGEHVIKALLRAVHDSQQSVRFRVVVALFRVAGIECTDDEGFGRIQALLESNHHSLRSVGVDWFRKLLKLKEAGKPYGDYAKELVLIERSEDFERFFEVYGERDDEAEELSEQEKQLLKNLSKDEAFRAEYAFLRDIFEGRPKAFPCLTVIASELTLSAVKHLKEVLSCETTETAEDEFDGIIPPHISPLEETIKKLKKRLVDHFLS